MSIISRKYCSCLDLNQSKDKVSLKTSYYSWKEYANSFYKAIKWEYDQEVLEKELCTLRNVTCALDFTKMPIEISFRIPKSYKGPPLKYKIGDRLKFLSEDLKEGVSYTGQIVKLSSSKDDRIRASFTVKNPKQFHKYRIEIYIDPTCHNRMIKALKYGHSSGLCQLILNRPLKLDSDLEDLLGCLTLHSDNRVDFTTPGLGSLNESQQKALELVFENEVTLIQGPPGTGKTVTSATIAYQLKYKRGMKVLIAAPSNSATDNICLKAIETGLKVVRAYSNSIEESNDATLKEYSILNLALKHPDCSEFRNLHLKRFSGDFSGKDYSEYTKFKNEAYKIILEESDIVCSTCSNSGAKYMEDIKFGGVIIDEATQAIEPEMLIPIKKGIEKLILVGDHCQLGPVVISKVAAEIGLRRSLFERLLKLNFVKTTLGIQYRMHPCISEFSNRVFYESKLRDGVTAKDRTVKNISFKWPCPETPMFFYDLASLEEKHKDLPSYCNIAEVWAVKALLKKLLDAGVQGKSIGVISPYRGQCLAIEEKIKSPKKPKFKDIEVASVDSFQGREMDYIIISSVRSRADPERGIGFLSDARRLNVAITRAKYGLIMIGNSETLCIDDLWNELINHFHKQGLVYEGSVDNLVPSTKTFVPNKEPYRFKPLC